MIQKRKFWEHFKKVAICMVSSSMFFTTAISNAQTITANTQGTHGGYFYSFWTENANNGASMTLGADGNYSTTWNNTLNFTAGKGWAVGKPDRTVCFEGTYNGGSNGFLALYGWTKNPLIEYYVCEKHGQWEPPGNTGGVEYKGTYTSDGGTYKMYTGLRENKPSIIGNATFQQFWSVRTEQRSSGTITFANHVKAWETMGNMKLGTTWDYQIMESEGYNSSGSSNITVKECVSCATPAPTVTPVVNYEVGDAASTLTASGTNLKWYTVATNGTGSSTAPKPNTSTAGTTVYYVSSTGNNCESSRSTITVNVLNTYKIYSISAPITIDGTIDGVWDNSNVMPLNATKLLSGAVTNASDLSGYGKMLWDNTNLYLLAIVTDDTKKNDSPNSYDDDQVEFYLDLDNAKATAYDANDFQYSFGWDDGTVVGIIPSTGPTTNIVYSAVSTANGYVIEAKIPWATLKTTPSAGKILGIDFMINDDDDGSGRDGKLSWYAAKDEAYKDASLFGTGKLIDQQLITGSIDFSYNNFTVFPNPSSGEVFVSGFENNFEYLVFDFAGRSVLEGVSSGKINIESLESGTYILNLKQGEKVKTLKVSKF